MWSGREVQAWIDAHWPADASRDAEVQRLREDAERLDWLERQATNGVHVECCHSGSFSGANLQRTCTLFMPSGDHKADNLRDAIDAARAALKEQA
jgi:hypothetical protein